MMLFLLNFLFIGFSSDLVYHPDLYSAMDLHDCVTASINTYFLGGKMFKQIQVKLGKISSNVNIYGLLARMFDK